MVSLVHYTGAEVERIRQVIAARGDPTDDRDLCHKMGQDPLLGRYGLFGFFPGAFELVYDSEVKPDFFLDRGHRGLVGIFRHPTRNIVVKPEQSPGEGEIARIAAELGVGPQQYPSLDGFLTEEFVEGDLFSQLPPERRSALMMKQLGQRVGDILTKLHHRGIYYNDVMLTDDFGKSHVFVTPEGNVKLFDYGVALDLRNHPQLTDGQVWNYVRTLPGFNFMADFGVAPQEIEACVNRFRPELEAMTKGDIMKRDLQFMVEGISLAGCRFGFEVMEAFDEGFKKAYQKR